MTAERNGHHDYEMNMLEWIVVQPFNGATDWNTIGAFESRSDAEKWCEFCNANPASYNLGFPCEVRYVGTAHRYEPNNCV